MNYEIILYDNVHGDGRFKSDWNRLWTALEPMYDANTLGVPKNLSVEERMHIHTFLYNINMLVLKPSEDLYVQLAGRERTVAQKEGGEVNGRVYDQLKQMVTELMHQLAQALPRTEVQFLEFVSRTEYHVRERARLMHNALHFSSTRWGSKAMDEGKPKFVDVLELHRTLLSTIFLPSIQDKVRTSVFKFILNGGSINCSAIQQRSVIRDIISSHRRISRTFLPTFSLRRRPIYLFSRRLEQLVLISRPTEACSRASKLLPCPPEVSPPRLHGSSVFANWMATFDHWGLLIGPPDTSELESLPRANGDSYDRAPASLLCELQALEQDDGYISAFVGAPEGRNFDNRSLCLLKGYTSCSDDQIRNYAQHAVSSMPRKYNALRNNCQMFCQKLLTCISTPTNVNELQSDYMELPLLIRNEVMSQRHIQLVPRLYQQIFEEKARAFPEVDQDNILPVERLAIGAKGFLMVITTVFFWGELHLRLYLLICLCAIDFLGSGSASGLTKLRYFEKKKMKPYGKYNKEFGEFIESVVRKFYHELEGETGALIELNDWKNNAMLRRPAMELHWTLPEGT